MGRIRRIGVIGVAALVVGGLALAVVPTESPVAAAGPNVIVASSMHQISPVGTASGMPTTASLSAVRNEAESFQLVVNGPATDVSVSGDLFGWGTTTLYRVGYYEATVKSDREGGVGSWGDALIPETDIMYHENRTAFPFAVAEGRNQLVWVDVFVPPTTAAGIYSDTLHVTSSGGITDIPVTLEVIDWTMPTTSTVKSAFYMTYDNGLSKVCRAHTGSGTCNGDSTKLRTLHALYSRLALEDRISIANGSGLLPDQSPLNGDPAGQWESLFESNVIRGETTVPMGASWRLANAQSTVVSQYGYGNGHCTAGCADGWEAEATEPGQVFSNQFVWYACDEPGTTAQNWINCGAKFSPVKAAWGASALVTAPIDQYQSRPAGTPSAQILVVLSRFMDGKIGYDHAGNQRSSYDAFLQTPGNEVWLYTACDSFACGDPSPADDHPLFDGWPGYAIDAPAVQSRAESWMLDKFAATGELYWAVDQRLMSAWTPGGLFDSGGNGDGTLFYPGTPTSVNGSLAIGGVHDIPLESIRLKRIRDGREDYEYLHHLALNGKALQVETLVNGLFPNHSSATASKDGDGDGSLLQTREELLMLMREVHPSPGRIVFSSNRDGDYELFMMNADGSNQRQLTFNAVDDRYPVFSHDGLRIAWSNGTDVMVMQADGTGVVNLTADIADPAVKPAYWPGDTPILFVRTPSGAIGSSEIWQMNDHGGDKSLVVGTGGTGAVFDPDVQEQTGTLFYSKAVSSTQTDLMRADLAAGVQQPIALVNGAGIINEVVATGFGARLSFSSSVGGGRYDIRVSNSDGSNAITVSSSVGGAGADDFQSTWSPDDSSIAFVSNVGADGDNEIWRVLATGASPVRLTNNAFSDVDPDWATTGTATRPPSPEPATVPPTTPPPANPPTSPPAPAPPPPTTAPPTTSVVGPQAPDFVALDPARLMDSRSDGATIDGKFIGTGSLPAGSVMKLSVGGRGQVPADAAAVALNVTVAGSAGSGFLTVYPCGGNRPTASNLNFVAGQIVPNAVIARLGSGGDVCLFSPVGVHVVVDVNGYYPLGTRYRSLVPARLADSRQGGITTDGLASGSGAIAAGRTLELRVSGRGGVGTDASAAFLNVTAVGADVPGFLTVYPCDAVRPNASSVNFVGANPVPNAVLTKISPTGLVCIFSSTAVHVVVDANGWYPQNSTFEALVPARLLDTRAAGVTVDGESAGGGRASGGTPVALAVRGRGGVSSGAGSVVLNVTVTEPSGSGFVTVYACGTTRPTASNLNFVAGQSVANLVMTRLASDGTVCLFSSVSAELVVDVVGDHIAGS